MRLKKYYNSIKRNIKNKSYLIFYYNKCLQELNINENCILLDSQQGKNLDGNIFYLLKELQKEEYSKFQKVVSVKKNNYQEFKNKLNNYGISDYILVKYESKKYLRILATAKYLFNDSSFLYYFRKRDDQVYFNTWHGTPFKNMGRRMEEDFHAIGNVQRNLLMSNYILFPNEYMKNLMIDSYMLDNISNNTYSFLSGYPRNEVFFDNKRRKELRKKLNIDDKEVIMYMPTWKGEFNNIDEDIKKQSKIYQSYLSEISKKLKKNQVMYVNFHPFLKGKIKIDNYDNIKLFDKKYETYDFLNMADILITDYSSVFFDFASTNRKIILFAYDEKEYFATRGTYFKFDELPFKKVITVDELIDEINNKNNVKIDKFLNKFCKYENINSSKKIIDFILKNETETLIEKIPSNNKKNILIYSGNLNKNGITTSLLSLLNRIDLDKYNIYLTYVTSSMINNKETLKNLDDRIRYFPITNRYIGTMKEKFYSVLFKLGKITYEKKKSILDNFYKNEIKRNYGNTHFDVVIQYSGYGSDVNTMFANFECKKLIYVHSNMVEEIKTRKNQRPNVLKSVYNKYDKVVIINELLRKPTEQIKGNSENIININNVIDYDNIINKSKLKPKFDENTTSNMKEEEIIKILNNKKKKIISVGRFSPEKGYDRLIEAFEKVNTDSYLIIIGGFGNLYDKIMEQAKKSVKKDQIIIIKNTSNPYSFIKKCDGMIISSYYEGLPMVLYEAIVLDKPVVSTNIPTIATFLETYKGGKIVDNSLEGLVEGINLIDNNKVDKTIINFKEYNDEIMKKLECLINEKN